MKSGTNRFSSHTGRILQLTVVLGVALSFAGCTLSEPVATVNNQRITRAEFDRTLIRDHGARVLLEMIDTELILTAGEKAGLTVSEGEIEAKVEQGISQMTSKDELLRALERRGQTLDDFKRFARAELLLEKMAQPLIDVSEPVLKEYYQHNITQFKHERQARARWMLFQDKASALAVREVLNDTKADFAGLAKGVSSDVVTAEKGGEMGWFAATDYAEAVSKTAFSLKPNQISDAFEVPDGWAVLQLQQTREAGDYPFDEVRDSIRARVSAEMMPQAKQRWIDEVRKNMSLQISDRRLKNNVQSLIDAHAQYQPTQLMAIPTIPAS